MTSIQRTAAELIGGALLVCAFGAWWAAHNHAEQKIGAQACIQATTETKTAAIADNIVDESAQAATLKKVVDAYDQKLQLVALNNADLVRRLHDNAALRSGAMSHPRPVTCGADALGRVLESEGQARQRRERIDADTVAVLDACDANQLKLEGAAAAYESARRLALEAQQRPDPHLP